MKDFILRNLWLKMASLVLATLIWLTVQANLEKETRMVQQTPSGADQLEKRDIVQRQFEFVPVAVRCDGTNCPAFRAEPSTVSVTVSGDSQKIWKMEAKDILVFVETGTVPHSGDLCPVQVSTGPNVTWLRVQPSLVRLKPGAY